MNHNIIIQAEASQEIDLLRAYLDRIGVKTELSSEGCYSLRWDDEEVEKKIGRKAGRRRANAKIRIDDVLPLLNQYWNLSGEDKNDFVKDNFGISARTFRRRYKFFVDKGFESLKNARDTGYIYFIDDEEKSRGE